MSSEGSCQSKNTPYYLAKTTETLQSSVEHRRDDGWRTVSTRWLVLPHFAKIILIIPLVFRNCFSGEGVPWILSTISVARAPKYCQAWA